MIQRWLAAPPVSPGMSDSPAIEVRELRKTYRDGLLRRRLVDALRGVSFDVPRGVIFGLLGPNGAGKTTLIKVLLGIVRPSGGEARLLGRPAGHRDGRRRVGYLPEQHRVPRHHTALTALRYFGGLSGMSPAAVARRAAELLPLVGLAGWGDVPVRKFSKGMQQRLGLAQALLHDPELLMLDEPTDGVDPVGRSELRAVMQRLKGQGKTIFLNSHLLQELELVCDRVVILDHGQVLRQGDLDELTVAARPDVVLTLAAGEAEARAALAGVAVRQWTVHNGHVDATLHAVEQPQLDAALDALRAGRLSVVSVVPRRQTLEEAFLATLEQARREPCDPT